MNQMSVWKQLTQLPFLQLYKKLVNSAMQMDVFPVHRILISSVNNQLNKAIHK